MYYLKSSICLLFLCLFVALSSCKYPKGRKPDETHNYYYVDQVYFQYKKSELLSCLVKEKPDTCGCASRYLRNGSPKPDKLPFEGEIEIDGRTVAHNCCDCIKVAASACPDFPCGVCNILHCKCPELEIAASDSTTTTFILSAGENNGKSDQTERQLQPKIVKFTLKNTDFYRYEFPKDFSGKVIMSFKGTPIALLSFQNGKVEDTDHPPCK